MCLNLEASSLPNNMLFPGPTVPCRHSPIYVDSHLLHYNYAPDNAQGRLTTAIESAWLKYKRHRASQVGELGDSKLAHGSKFCAINHQCSDSNNTNNA